MAGAALKDRGLVRVAGAGATAFLQSLLTNDVTGLEPHAARYAALLSPQGKILVDMFVTPAHEEIGGGFWLDCPLALAPDLAARLEKYKLRAKVAIEDLSDAMAVVAVWDADRPQVVAEVFADPRAAALGWRVLCVASEAEEVAARFGTANVEAYEARRIALGVPRGGLDFAYGDAFPHEASMDRWRGVDFHKGCYVGQEVVSRVEHRGTARKRVVAVEIDGPRPEIGAPIMAGDVEIGVMGSAAHGRGLALLRLDKAADAATAGAPLTCGGVGLRLVDA
jgi:hypothetical protein